MYNQVQSQLGTLVKDMIPHINLQEDLLKKPLLFSALETFNACLVGL